MTDDGGLMIDALDTPENVKAVDKAIQKFADRTRKDVIIHLKRTDDDYTKPDRMFEFDSASEALLDFDKRVSRKR